MVKDLFQEYKEISFFIPKKLNQDSLENLFSMIRGCLGSNCHPTVLQIGYILAKFWSHKELKSKGSNCAGDDENFLQLEVLPNVETVETGSVMSINEFPGDYCKSTIRYSIIYFR